MEKLLFFTAYLNWSSTHFLQYEWPQLSSRCISSSSIEHKHIPQSRSFAIEMLTEYLKELKSGKTKKLSLRGSDKPPGVMKELMLRCQF
jgi:hypothetical protein